MKRPFVFIFLLVAGLALFSTLRSYLTRTAHPPLQSNPDPRSHERPAFSLLRSGRETVFYAPETNLERIDLELLAHPQNVELALYAFTDSPLAEHLGALASTGVTIYLYRDRTQYEEEERRAETRPSLSVMHWLRRRSNVHVRLKGGNGPMHLNAVCVDCDRADGVLRLGSASWTSDAERTDDNEVRVLHEPEKVTAFHKHFQELWLRPDNTTVQ